MITILIPGPAVPWQRTATHEGRKLTPKPQREYQRHVKACASAALLCLSSWDRSLRYSVHIAYTPQDKRRRDLDNIAKTILDACNGVIWDDDSQVDQLLIRRTRELNVGVSMIVIPFGGEYIAPEPMPMPDDMTVVDVSGMVNRR